MICKKLVKQLGPFNKIYLESEINKGSSFYFFIYTNLGKENKETFEKPCKYEYTEQQINL